MKRLVTLLLITALTISSCFMLSGCGQEEYTNLQAYVDAHPDCTSAIDDMLKNQENKSLNLSVAFDKNCCIITHKYKDTLDDDVVADLSKGFESQADVYEENCKDAIDDLVKNTGFKGITIKIVYVNGNDQEIWSKEYAKQQ